MQLTFLQSLLERQTLKHLEINQVWQKIHFFIKGECQNNGEISYSLLFIIGICLSLIVFKITYCFLDPQCQGVGLGCVSLQTCNIYLCLNNEKIEKFVSLECAHCGWLLCVNDDLVSEKGCVCFCCIFVCRCKREIM